MARRGIDDDAGNSYAHAMCWYRDHLYVGTTRHLGAFPRVARKPPVDPVEVHHVRRAKLHFEMDLRARIFRFSPATGEWRCLYVAPWVTGTRGFEITRVMGFRAATVYQSPDDDEPALYLTGWGHTMGPGPFLFRSVDGEHLEEIEIDDPFIAKQTLRSLTPFKGRLFAAPSPQGGGLMKGLYQLLALVYTCTDPVKGDWEVANPVSFGDPHNLSVASLAVFDDHLYAGTMNPFTGFEVWKTDAEGSPPFHWTKVIDHGAYRGNLNEVASTLFGFKDHLYVGSMLLGGGFDPMWSIGPAAVELVRIDRDNHWELIMGDPRHTPDGFVAPISGILPGFNNPFAGYLWAMTEYEGCLYASTMTTTPWFRFFRKDLWPDRYRHVLTPDWEERILEAYGGFGLWTTSDGETWSPVTVNGFDNPYSIGTRTLVPTPYGLFAGTASQFGPDTAVRRLAGWRFEMKTRAGMEIWLGARPAYEKEVPKAAPVNPNVPAIGRKQPRTQTESPLVDAYYDQTPWRLHGYWAAHIHDPVAACENLMAELLAFVTPDIPTGSPVYPSEDEIKAWVEEKGPDAAPRAVANPPDRRLRVKVVDVRCELGATTLWLSEFYPEDWIQGVTSSRTVYSQARRLHPHLTFSRGSLPRLGQSTGSIDHVFCVEGPSRCGDLERVFAEFLRILVPGGTVVFADFLVATHPAADLDAYRNLLRQTGFVDIRMFDVAEKTIEPFTKQRQVFLQEKMLDGRYRPEEIDRAAEALHGGHSPPVAYWIGAATKPQAS